MAIQDIRVSCQCFIPTKLKVSLPRLWYNSGVQYHTAVFLKLYAVGGLTANVRNP